MSLLRYSASVQAVVHKIMEQTFLYVMQLLLITTSSSKSLLNCEKVLPTLAQLESSILTQLGDSGPVIGDSIQYICLAQGNVQGMYRAASVIIAYHNHHRGPTKVRHFHVHCYNNAWLIDDGEPSHHHHHLGSHATRSDCRQCNQLYNITNCNGEFKSAMILQLSNNYINIDLCSRM